MFNHADLGRRTLVKLYFKEEFVVFFGQRDAGNLKPVTGWKEKELKVASVSTGAVKEKNEPAPIREGGNFKTAEVQQAYFVTVIAENEEEACLVVDRFLSQGLANSTEKTTLENFGGGGPSIKPFVNAGGKAVAGKASALKEVVGIL